MYGPEERNTLRGWIDGVPDAAAHKFITVTMDRACLLAGAFRQGTALVTPGEIKKRMQRIERLAGELVGALDETTDLDWSRLGRADLLLQDPPRRVPSPAALIPPLSDALHQLQWLAAENRKLIPSGKGTSPKKTLTRLLASIAADAHCEVIGGIPGAWFTDYCEEFGSMFNLKIGRDLISGAIESSARKSAKCQPE